jgi:hypothetical protein
MTHAEAWGRVRGRRGTAYAMADAYFHPLAGSRREATAEVVESRARARALVAQATTATAQHGLVPVRRAECGGAHARADALASRRGRVAAPEQPATAICSGRVVHGGSALTQTESDVGAQRQSSSRYVLGLPIGYGHRQVQTVLSIGYGRGRTGGYPTISGLAHNASVAVARGTPGCDHGATALGAPGPRRSRPHAGYGSRGAARGRLRRHGTSPLLIPRFARTTPLPAAELARPQTTASNREPRSAARRQRTCPEEAGVQRTRRCTS